MEICCEAEGLDTAELPFVLLAGLKLLRSSWQYADGGDYDCLQLASYACQAHCGFPTSTAWGVRHWPQRHFTE